MQMRRLLLFLFTLLIGTVATAQPGNTKDYNAYDFDTTLQGGYSISFQTDDSLQYLYLKKGRRTIAELSSMSKGLPYKNLGYIGVDCTRYFVLVHSFGFGNPHYIELIKKVNGKMF
ncbi:MAG: hypothetical protein JWR61_3491 [Ferruginibacter sp.]|nr:hypothetical protein [Ferruginibacter sp.]